MDGAHGFEGLGSERDEGLERNARAILSIKEVRDREWRAAREKNGRPVGVGSPGDGLTDDYAEQNGKPYRHYHEKLHQI
jgi:hypothetical protein